MHDGFEPTIIRVGALQILTVRRVASPFVNLGVRIRIAVHMFRPAAYDPIGSIELNYCPSHSSSSSSHSQQLLQQPQSSQSSWGISPQLSHSSTSSFSTSITSSCLV